MTRLCVLLAVCGCLIAVAITESAIAVPPGQSAPRAGTVVALSHSSNREVMMCRAVLRTGQVVGFAHNNQEARGLKSDFVNAYALRECEGSIVEAVLLQVDGVSLGDSVGRTVVAGTARLKVIAAPEASAALDAHLTVHGPALPDGTYGVVIREGSVERDSKIAVVE